MLFFCVYDKFERGTGVKLNMEKCEGLWLDGWVHRSDCPVTIQWTSGKIKVLGVFLGTGIWTNAVGDLVWMLSRATSIPGVLVTYHSLAVVVGSSQHVDPVAVDSVSTKSCYVLLLFLTPCTPHCVSKFSPIYGPIDWKSTWASLYVLPSDRHVSDVNRKIAHGALYIADRLISFGLDVPAACLWCCLGEACSFVLPLSSREEWC